MDEPRSDEGRVGPLGPPGSGRGPIASGLPGPADNRTRHLERLRAVHQQRLLVLHRADVWQAEVPTRGRRPPGGPSPRGPRRSKLPARRAGGLLQLPGYRLGVVRDAADQWTRDSRAAGRNSSGGPEPEGLAYGQWGSGDDGRASGRGHGGDAGPRGLRHAGHQPLVRTRVGGSARHGGEQPEHRRGRMPRGDPDGECPRARTRREWHAAASPRPQFRRGPRWRDEEDVRLESRVPEASPERGSLGPPDQYPSGPTGASGV